MTVDLAVVPGLVLLALELIVLAAVGYVVVRVALRQDSKGMAMAQGLVVGPALWGLIVNFVLHIVPGLAGAAVGWGFAVILGTVLARREFHRIRTRPRMIAGFATVGFALLWVSLASRQTMSIPDPHQHLGIAAALRAGAFPPEISWSPGSPLRYHYGIELLTGLLSPPSGPDLALVSEVLGAYCWTSLALVTATALHRRGGWFAVAAVAPLLITAGAWTWRGMPIVVAFVPFVGANLSPDGMSFLTEAYWPIPPADSTAFALPDIWLPAFTFAYALALVVLERSSQTGRGAWSVHLSIAALIGFLGLVQTAVLVVTLILWAGVQAAHLIRLRRAETDLNRTAAQSIAALALAALLLVFGGGVLTRAIDGSSAGGLTIAQSAPAGLGRVLGNLPDGHGSSGALAGVGPLLAVGLAVSLARRDRLVILLALGAGLFTLAWITLEYPPHPWDMNRIAGHGRNFALAALVLALGVGLARLGPNWRSGAGVLLVLLIVWPTIVKPGRILATSLAGGVEISNAVRRESIPASQLTSGASPRFAMPDVSEAIVDYIREHTSISTRVFTSGRNAWDLTIATGRPNASGFLEHAHQVHQVGPEYLDVLRFLEPAAVRRGGIQYVHGTDAWVAALPDRARALLDNPDLFELVVRDGDHRLVRVRPEFLSLDSPPNPASFEALRQTVPPSATVYVLFPPRKPTTLRIASALSHTKLVGQIDPQLIHLIPPATWQLDSLIDQTPDLVVLPRDKEPWMFAPSVRTPIWWNDDVAVYAPNGAVPPIMVTQPAAERLAADPPPVLVDVMDVTVADGRIAFTARFDERDPELWTSQDWVLYTGDRSPWAIPTEVFRSGRSPTVAKWFQGLLSSGGASTWHPYRFDARTSELSVGSRDGNDFTPLPASAERLAPGGYTLALRLRHEFQPNQWRDAAVIPVVRIRVAEGGEAIYEPFPDILGEPTS